MTERPIIAFGPATDWGSWQWVGADIMQALSSAFNTVTWDDPMVRRCDVLFAVKFLPDADVLADIARFAKIVYCPVDRYDSPEEIRADWRRLRYCARIVIHCHRLRGYFEPYAPVTYLDHHIKFAAPLRRTFVAEGDILWVGVRTNLPPLVEWINEHSLPADLTVLTNLENPQTPPSPSDLGMRTSQHVRILNWSAELQLSLTSRARCAIDIKGTDFRQRHKPAAKLLDFLASGIPVAMNRPSSGVDHLAECGFDVASPLDAKRWLSYGYWRDTQRFGRAIRELCSLPRIAVRYQHLIQQLLAVESSCEGWSTL